MKRYNWLIHVGLAIYSIFFAAPLIWMALSAFKGNDEIFDKPFSSPHNYNLKVFIDAWNIGGLSKYFLNSALITGISTALVLISASLAAFAFSRFAFKGNKQLLMVFMIGLLLPIQAYFISQNKIFEYLNLKDHRLTLVIPYVGLGIPLATWLFKAYLDSLPKELFEAARVDGGSDFTMYRYVAAPLLKPGIATVAVFNALGTWNEFLLAMIYIQNESYKTIPVGLLTFSTRYSTDYQMLFAALTVITIPMIIIYIAFNRQIVAGLTEGSLK
ncbi:MAG: carbohydrate ABC transporter permease [Actinobacteria bacterium]|nr:carbohydrate ABC transporter permease [Actinomycetota bacterium]NDH13030.1 carbohydrate ABC transporter permease [Actinomycetota bacterium]